jgi:hypothetical protein
MDYPFFFSSQKYFIYLIFKLILFNFKMEPRRLPCLVITVTIIFAFILLGESTRNGRLASRFRLATRKIITAAEYFEQEPLEGELEQAFTTNMKGNSFR